ncbi:MAG TPA: PilZ domain-containing protein [Gammaproteobacteria bacterium]|nr:PilZ domain-containing protein [Gammaproteobacteria bacterium]
MSDTDNTEKRHFSRIPFVTDVHLVNAEGSWDVQLVDVSLKGILTTVPANPAIKTGEHYLAEMLTENDEATIRMEVSVAHIEEQRVGFRCEHIDLDSISHLRRLVELNLGDDEILHRELSELLHHSED